MSNILSGVPVTHSISRLEVPDLFHSKLHLSLKIIKSDVVVGFGKITESRGNSGMEDQRGENILLIPTSPSRRTTRIATQLPSICCISQS